MGKRLKELNPALQNFIEDQKIFFVGTARSQGSVNVSPKGMDTFRIINNRSIVWLNLTGSGNETAAHLLENNRMTIMFCSFEEMPLILRIYGNAKIYYENDKEYGNININALLISNVMRNSDTSPSYTTYLLRLIGTLLQ